MDTLAPPSRAASASAERSKGEIVPGGSSRASRAHVRCGSKADIEEGATDVRFTPESGHWNSADKCPLSRREEQEEEDADVTGTPQHSGHTLTLHKRTSAHVRVMSALPQKADIR
jgi:hypothetical protein